MFKRVLEVFELFFNGSDYTQRFHEDTRLNLNRYRERH